MQQAHVCGKMRCLFLILPTKIWLLYRFSTRGNRLYRVHKHTFLNHGIKIIPRPSIQKYRGDSGFAYLDPLLVGLDCIHRTEYFQWPFVMTSLMCVWMWYELGIIFITSAKEVMFPVRSVCLFVSRTFVKPGGTMGQERTHFILEQIWIMGTVHNVLFTWCLDWV